MAEPYAQQGRMLDNGRLVRTLRDPFGQGPLARSGDPVQTFVAQVVLAGRARLCVANPFEATQLAVYLARRRAPVEEAQARIRPFLDVVARELSTERQQPEHRPRRCRHLVVTRAAPGHRY